jgi:hypothetical protein
MSVGIDPEGARAMLAGQPPIFRPFAGPARPLQIESTSKLGKEAARLWSAVERALAQQRKVDQLHAAAVRVAQEAHARYEAALARAEQGEINEDAQTAHRKFERLLAEAEGEVHTARKTAAARALAEAEETYQRFLREHNLELIDEIRPSAESLAAEYEKLVDECEARLRPLRQRHGELRDACIQLIGADARFRPSDLPDGDRYHVPPVPSAEVIARVKDPPEPQSTQAA